MHVRVHSILIAFLSILHFLLISTYIKSIVDFNYNLYFI